ncbi:MAG: F0F1 ATP synthase subunit B [Flavobacteriaceae bacterium]|nr:F0F1 ATP synthase subunit B [Flavobacteriaceae bacterium]
MELIKPEFGLFFWQVVVLVILVFLLGKFAWKPILQGIKEREDSINDSINAAEDAKKELMHLQEKNQDMLNEARIERDQMLKEAQAAKKRMLEEANTQATQKAAQIVAKAQEAIEADKKAALVEIKSEVASLSIDIAEKILGQNLKDDKAQRQLVEQMLKDVKLN